MRPLLCLCAFLSSLAAASSGSREAPLFFVENRGQAAAPVRFTAKASELEAVFAPTSAELRVHGAVVQMYFEGAQRSTVIEGSERMAGSANFLIGSSDQWRADVPLYGGIVYRSLYPGIDLAYGASGRKLKSEFRVARGADPRQIRVRYHGAEAIHVASGGALLVAVGGRTLREDAPVIFQVRGERKQAVSGSFDVRADGAVGFIVGEYDRTLPLIIDPVLTYSTLLGGSGQDTATAVAVDATGAAYIAGFTESRDLPVASPMQSLSGGSNDAFVVKLNASGTAIVYCTYLGGSGDDRANGIAVDAAGAAYVVGSTRSANFPVRNAWQPRMNGAGNAFLAKLSPTGNTLIYGTFLGGNGSDVANGVAVDSTGNAYVAGDAASVNFPILGFHQGYAGVTHAFAAKFSADGSRLVYSAMLGGSNTDRGLAIAVNGAGEAHVTGSTYSTDFPVMNAFQAYNGGGQDAFVTKLRADGSSLVFSTYLGGSSGGAGYGEAGQGIALDAQGGVYVAGVASSANFPVLHAAQTALYGWSDAFAAKFTAAGALVYSTFVGGSGPDVANAVAVDSIGKAYVTGYTYSDDFPIVAALQTANAGNSDAFLAVLGAAGDTISFATYLGGGNADAGTAVALDGFGNLFVAGLTQSMNFPLKGAVQTINAGNFGAFVMKMQVTVPPVTVAVSPSAGSGATQTFTFDFSDPNGIADLTSVLALFNGSASLPGACGIAYNRAQNTLSLYTDGGTAGAAIGLGSGTAQNSQCTISGGAVSVAGNDLLLTVSIGFSPAFGGSKTVYLQAIGTAASSGWQTMGTWAVPATVAVTADSVTPSGSSGAAQTFVLQYSDTNGGGDIAQAWVWINSSFSSAANSCMVYYSKPVGGVFLLQDGGSFWSGPAVVGMSGTLSNSQCSINLANSAVSAVGNRLVVTLAFTFANAYAGSKNIYAFATNGLIASGWQTVGSWTVPAATAAVTADSVTPSGSAGSAQTFVLQYSDTNGGGDIAQAWMWINNSFSSAGSSCMVYYSKTVNGLFLLQDGGSLWTGPAPVGGMGTLSNSQCSINLAGSSSVIAGNRLVVTLPVTFANGYAGAKNVYAFATNGAVNSGWQTVGTWTVPAQAAAITSDSVNPSAGSGSAQIFALQYSDTSGGGDITQAWVWINESFGLSANSCMVYYSKPANGVFLLQDGGSLWTGPAVLGGTGSLSNSQCSIDLASSSAAVSGTRLTLSLALAFAPQYTGRKNVFAFATNTIVNSGWQTLGTWIVP